MSSSNPSEASKQSPEKKRRFLTAEKKFQIYLEAQEGGKPVGELLRREGLFSTDLARIRQQVKEGALQRLGAKPGRQQSQVSTEAYEAIKLELQNKERALADLSVELAILRKKTNGGSWDR
jgi:transposase-like protein